MNARLRVDLGLVGSFLRSGGGPRAVPIALCTALVSGLLMVALNVVLFTWASSREREQVSGLVADGGVRGGYVLALLLICLPPLALLRQVVRLGSATRGQRLAALRLAGATTADVRRLGALEVGLPALAGGFLGCLVFGVLGSVFGGTARSGTGNEFAASEVARQLRLVPTTVHPAWWELLLIALGVALLGVLAGATTSRSLLISPLGVSRRAPRSAPRPWALLLVVLAVALFVLSTDSSSAAGDVFALGFVGTLVLGLLALAPWVAYRVGRVVAARASTVPVLIAGRRLATDARPAGRAAAAVGAIAVVAGGGGAVLADLPSARLGARGSVGSTRSTPFPWRSAGWCCSPRWCWSCSRWRSTGWSPSSTTSGRCLPGGARRLRPRARGSAAVGGRARSLRRKNASRRSGDGVRLRARCWQCTASSITVVSTGARACLALRRGAGPCEAGR